MASEDFLRARIASLRTFQELHDVPVSNHVSQSPAKALKSLNDAVTAAPVSYRNYLVEAVTCYENSLYRAAILMVWAATVEHLYLVASGHPTALTISRSPISFFGRASNYRRIKKKDHFLYLGEANWMTLAEDPGMMNKNARLMLVERLTPRNRCGHPTLYRPGREETVIFIQSILLNVLSGTMLNW